MRVQDTEKNGLRLYRTTNQTRMFVKQLRGKGGVLGQNFNLASFLICYSSIILLSKMGSHVAQLQTVLIL